MTKDTHTPGPWHTGCDQLGRTNIYGSGWMVADARPHKIAVGDSYFTEDTNLANARLIAAAPELLDVLTMALPYVEMAEHDDSYKTGVVAKMVQRMNNAIAAATGGEA